MLDSGNAALIQTKTNGPLNALNAPVCPIPPPLVFSKTTTRHYTPFNLGVFGDIVRGLRGGLFQIVA